MSDLERGMAALARDGETVTTMTALVERIGRLERKLELTVQVADLWRELAFSGAKRTHRPYAIPVDIESVDAALTHYGVIPEERA